MVERQPSKLHTRVRFPSPAPEFRAGNFMFGSYVFAGVAQLVEHFIGNEEVGSSILLPSLSLEVKLA
jgi:hypothetical protein